MAENTFQKASITSEAAQRMIVAAEAKAREMGKTDVYCRVRWRWYPQSVQSHGWSTVAKRADRAGQGVHVDQFWHGDP